jgi:hypothetical protein
MLDNDASIPCDGIANDGWYGVNVEVGDTLGFFYYNTTYVNDSLDNVASNTTALFLTITANEPPKWFDNQTNDTSIDIGDSVNHSVRWTDDTDLARYIFNWNAEGSDCNQETDISEGEMTGTGNWSNVTQVIPTVCEGKTITWKIWANDSENAFNLTDDFVYDVINTSPIIDDSSHRINVTLVGNNDRVKLNVSITDNTGNSNATFNLDGTNYTAENNYPEFFLTRQCTSSGIEWWNETWANDSIGNWDGNISVDQYWECDADAPSVSGTAVNDTLIYQNEYICVNATITDSNLDDSWVMYTSPSGTQYNSSFMTDNDANVVCAKGAGDDVWGVNILLTNVGNWSINTTWANDTLLQLGVQEAYPNLQVNVTAPPDTEPTKWQFNQTNISSPDPNQAILHSVNWTDNVGLSAYIFGWNASGSFVNDTSQTLSGLSDWSNVTKTVPGNLEGQIIVWRIWANDSNNNGNETDNQTYLVNSENPVITDSQHIMNQSVVGSNEAVGFGIYVTDNSGNSNVTITIEGAN